MTLWQAVASLNIPAHFTDWYMADAAQGTHLIFGVIAFAALAWADGVIAMKRGESPMPTHVMTLAAIAECAWFEVINVMLYRKR